jgi:hypothetical protein
LDKQELDEQEEVRLAMANLAQLEASLALSLKRNTRAELELNEAQERIQSREEKKLRREATRAERVAIRGEEKNLVDTLVATKESLEGSKRAISKIEGIVAVVDALREENNTLECERVLPSRSECEDLRRQTVVLTAMIQADEINPVIVELEKNAELDALELESLEQEMVCLAGEFDEKESKLVECELILENHNDATRKELASLELSMDDLVRRLEESSCDQNSKAILADHHLKMQVLRKGAKLIKQTAKAETKIFDMATDHFGLDGSSKIKYGYNDDMTVS